MLERVKLLLKNNAEATNADNKFEFTPLHLFAMNYSGDDLNDIIALLVQHGADINAKNSEGGTPLDVARELGNAVAVSALVEAGAGE